MKSLFPFYGGKWRMARRLGPPQRDLVIEPFAGSAGYSVYWEPPKVILVERDDVIAAVWKYLTRVKSSEIMSLPVRIMHVDELGGVCQEARWLVGFWMNPGTSHPSLQRSNWAREWLAGTNSDLDGCNVWSERNQARIARQVDKLRHWKIVHGTYERAPDTEAHWHVDPPYIGAAGRAYKHNEIDYASLGDWCRKREGFVHVCEAEGARWLPFRHFATIKGTEGKNRKGFSAEALYQQGRERFSLFDDETGDQHERRERANRSDRHQAITRPSEVPRGHDVVRQREASGGEIPRIEPTGTGVVQQRHGHLREAKSGRDGRSTSRISSGGTDRGTPGPRTNGSKGARNPGRGA